MCNCDRNEGCKTKNYDKKQLKKDARKGEDNAAEACCECGGGNKKP